MDSERNNIFRINMYILQAMYETLYDEMCRKHPTSPYIEFIKNKDCLYDILYTNRTDFSKYKTGTKEKATNKMIKELENNCKGLGKIIKGDELLRCSDRVNKTWANQIVNKVNSSEMLKECKIEVKQLVMNYVNEIDKEKNDLASRTIKWMGTSIVNWVKNRESGIDPTIIRISKEIKGIKIDKLETASDEAILALYTAMKEAWLDLSAIYTYRKRRGVYNKPQT